MKVPDRTTFTSPLRERYFPLWRFCTFYSFASPRLTPWLQRVNSRSLVLTLPALPFLSSSSNRSPFPSSSLFTWPGKSVSPIPPYGQCLKYLRFGGHLFALLSPVDADSGSSFFFHLLYSVGHERRATLQLLLYFLIHGKRCPAMRRVRISSPPPEK